MATFYILLMSWGGSTLSELFLVMFFVGLFKYWERVLILYSASEKQFRDSISDIPTNDSKIMEECKLKQLEGYYLTTHLVLEVDQSTNTSTVEFFTHANELLKAYGLLEMVKRLIADLILGFQDRDASRAIFGRLKNHTEAYRIIEIELGLVYDVLYTKAKVIYSFWGIARRISGVFLTSIVLVVVCLNETLSTEKQHHSKIDFTLTLVLLVVALLLELYAIVELLRSDQTAHWLIKHNKTTILQLINITLRPNWVSKCRWSNSIAQFSLLKFSQSRKALPCSGILKMLGVDEMLDIYQYGTSVPLKDYVRQAIFSDIYNFRAWPEANDYGTDLKALYGCRGGRTLKKYNRGDLEWSVELEFDQSILIWHLATEICYYADHVPREEVTLRTINYITSPGDGQSTKGLLQRQSKFISRYMLYLLVQHPEMLPIGMAHIRFRDIYAELSNFVQEQMSNSLKGLDKSSHRKNISDMLKKMKTNVMLTAQGGDRSNFVIFHVCKLASAFKDKDKLYEGDPEGWKYWEMIMNVWVEILGHAASQCKGRHHAQQLRRGGEFLTHVWLLMAHFGLTDHFRIPRSRAIADAVLR
ncbi:uncharacterized protein LOC115986273 [Quercus lobata]|uniref:uncharacterized protein LOC115986273 n=1 Tax=Quercus lobata TaxID=97700 RepID=UPI0012467CBF|nr:uncharacterized protein LOC115986273 [Quercus lobata]